MTHQSRHREERHGTSSSELGEVTGRVYRDFMPSRLKSGLLSFGLFVPMVTSVSDALLRTSRSGLE